MATPLEPNNNNENTPLQSIQLQKNLYRDLGLALVKLKAECVTMESQIKEFYDAVSSEGYSLAARMDRDRLGSPSPLMKEILQWYGHFYDKENEENEESEVNEENQVNDGNQDNKYSLSHIYSKEELIVYHARTNAQLVLLKLLHEAELGCEINLDFDLVESTFDSGEPLSDGGEQVLVERNIRTLFDTLSSGFCDPILDYLTSELKHTIELYSEFYWQLERTLELCQDNAKGLADIKRVRKVFEGPKS